MPPIFVTDDVSKLEISREVSEPQRENMSDMLTTFVVLKPERSKEVKLSHDLNM